MRFIRSRSAHPLLQCSPITLLIPMSKYTSATHPLLLCFYPLFAPRVITPRLLHARQGVAHVAAGAALLGDEYALSESEGGSAERDRSAACFGVVRNPDFEGGGHGE